MKTEEAREKIEAIISNNGHLFNKSDVARAAGVSPQVLNYQLTIAHKMDPDLVDDIFKYFARKGIEVTERSDKDVMRISGLFLEFSSMNSQHNHILANEIIKALEDNKIDVDEKERLLSKIRVYRKDNEKSLDHLENLLLGL